VWRHLSDCGRGRGACLLTTFSLWLLPVVGFASGMDPICKFSTSASGSISNARYRIADAYQRADLVAVGTGIENPENGKPQDFEVSVVVKGSSKAGQRLKLVGPRCQGTACDGLSVPPRRRFLLMLRQVPGGAFHKVDGNGNDACPNAFEVNADYAKIGAGRIKLESLRSYFESRPEPIPFE
jgi:hypothetical protein